jgi:hypothetical protein
MSKLEQNLPNGLCRGILYSFSLRKERLNTIILHCWPLEVALKQYTALRRVRGSMPSRKRVINRKITSSKQQNSNHRAQG